MIAKIDGKEVDIKRVSVVAKCSDLCSVRLLDAKKNILKDHDGYVPDFFPGDHCGDYVELEIEMDTGKILNWKPSKTSVAVTLKKWKKEEENDKQLEANRP